MRFTKKSIVAATAATAVVALGGTAAFAYFTSTGSGGSTANVGTATPWQVVASPGAGDPLYPGGPAQTFVYFVQNVGTTPQTLNSVTAAINTDGNGDAVGTATGCQAAWFSVAISGDPAGPVAAGGTNQGTGTVSMLESGTNQDVCQGKSPGFTLTAS